MSENNQQQRYRVIERIAAGGMAEVFRAESAGLEGFKKIVALKRVLPHLAEKQQFIKMFQDEARLSAQLNHSNCVQVFDIGAGGGTYFIVMEFVDGTDLKAVMDSAREKGRKIPPALALYITTQICEGLHYAHEAKDTRGRKLGIVHRDVSPPNVLITRHGEIKVVDFGLAKANSQLEESEPGVIKGKFSYLSPEAALGNSIDARTDVFATGIILWEMLAGRRLFLGETDILTVRQVQQANIPSLMEINPAVSPELERVVMKALAADPEHRYRTARDFATDATVALFRIGQPITAWDVANLAIEAMRERAIEKRKEGTSSKISDMIQQTMMEFTSLGAKGGTDLPSVIGMPADDGSIAGFDLGNLDSFSGLGGDLLATGQTRSNARHTLSGLDIGNLAALEEGGFAEVIEAAKAANQAKNTPGGGLAQPPSSTKKLDTAPGANAQPAKGGSGLMIALLTVVVLAALGAFAYLRGLIQF